MAIFRNGQTRSKAGVAATSVGGGDSRFWATLDLADAGLKIFLIEHSPCPGGHVTRLGFMFLPRRGASGRGYGCTWPFISPAHIHHNQQSNVEVLTNARVIGVEGQARDFTLSLHPEPHDADVERCLVHGYTPPGERLDIKSMKTNDFAKDTQHRQQLRTAALH
jgi:heterodisulfide reductase subunit A-like polyferredoxin